MISCPLKQTNEIDWVHPLKQYIRTTYGDDPERYSEECSTLNRLRQDMRGAGADSASGRDLLYRYYGQLELLDLRFPVDENHIKISFTWLVWLVTFHSMTNHCSGSTPSLTNPPRSTPLRTRKRRSSSTSQPFCHVTPRTRAALKTVDSRPHIIPSKPPRACSPT
jgi:hypothetical protein